MKPKTFEEAVVEDLKRIRKKHNALCVAVMILATSNFLVGLIYFVREVYR